MTAAQGVLKISRWVLISQKMRNFVILFLALSEAIEEFYDRSFIEFHEKYIYPDILEKTGVSKNRIYIII